MKTAGLILAGGKSRRLGSHKFNKKLGDLTLLEHTAKRFIPQVDALAANLPLGSNHDDYITLHEPKVDGKELGPLAGVMLGFDWARSIGAEVLVTMPVDVPFFPSDMVNSLQENQIGSQPVCVVAEDRRHGLCAIWPLTCQSQFTKSFKEDDVRTVNQMLDILGVREVVFETDNILMFYNINTLQNIDFANNYLDKN